MDGADPIFPLIDRRAPLLDRIRNDESNERLSGMLATAISELVKSDDEEAIENTRENLTENISDELADKLGVSADDINQGYVEELTDLITEAKEEDVLTDDALQSLGIKATEDAEEEEDESDEGPSLFD